MTNNTGCGSLPPTITDDHLAEAESRASGQLNFWQRLCAIPRFGFIKSADGGIVRAEGLGNWIDRDEAVKIVDAAQDEISALQAERDALRRQLEQVGQCAHQFAYFGSYPRRRCNICLTLEPAQQSDAVPPAPAEAAQPADSVLVPRKALGRLASAAVVPCNFETGERGCIHCGTVIISGLEHDDECPVGIAKRLLAGGGA